MSQALGFGYGSGVIKVRKITEAQRARSERRHVLAWKVRNFFSQQWRSVPLELFILLLPFLRRWIIPGLSISYGTVHLRKFDSATGRWIDYGKAGRFLKTTVGKQYIAACYDNTNEPENLKFHGFGSGTTAVAVGDTTLTTEYTTQYQSSNTRPTGSQAHSGVTYTTVGTFTPSSSVTCAEWGLFTQAATGGGTLFDHQTFTGVPLNGTGDSLQITYTYTEA